MYHLIYNNMQTKYFVLAAAMVCAVSMVANNKVSGVIKDAADNGPVTICMDTKNKE